MGDDGRVPHMLLPAAEYEDSTCLLCVFVCISILAFDVFSYFPTGILIRVFCSPTFILVILKFAAEYDVSFEH